MIGGSSVLALSRLSLCSEYLEPIFRLLKFGSFISVFASLSCAYDVETIGTPLMCLRSGPLGMVIMSVLPLVPLTM